MRKLNFTKIFVWILKKYISFFFFVWIFKKNLTAHCESSGPADYFHHHYVLVISYLFFVDLFFIFVLQTSWMIFVGLSLLASEAVIQSEEVKMELIPPPPPRPTTAALQSTAIRFTIQPQPSKIWHPDVSGLESAAATMWKLKRSCMISQVIWMMAWMNQGI